MICCSYNHMHPSSHPSVCPSIRPSIHPPTCTYTAVHYTAVHYTASCYIALHYITLHCVTLHCVAVLSQFYHIILHYIPWHCVACYMALPTHTQIVYICTYIYIYIQQQAVPGTKGMLTSPLNILLELSWGVTQGTPGAWPLGATRPRWLLVSPTVCLGHPCPYHMSQIRDWGLFFCLLGYNILTNPRFQSTLLLVQVPLLLVSNHCCYWLVCCPSIYCCVGEIPIFDGWSNRFFHFGWSIIFPA